MKNSTRNRHGNVETTPDNVRINLSLGLQVSRAVCFIAELIRDRVSV